MAKLNASIIAEPIEFIESNYIEEKQVESEPESTEVIESETINEEFLTDEIFEDVEDEDQQEDSNNEGKDQADQDESLGELDGGVHLGHGSARVLGAGGGGDGGVGSLVLGSDSVKVIEQFAGVENSVGAGG
jgi:hypothetical protein